MSAAFDRGESRPAPQSKPPDDKPAEPAVGSQMLDQILELALGGSPQAGFVEPEDVTAMRQVARSLAGQPFSLEPVVVELIHAVLHLQFHKGRNSFVDSSRHGSANRYNALRRSVGTRATRSIVGRIVSQIAMSTISKNREQLIDECQGLVRSLALKIQKGLPPTWSWTI